MAFENRETWNPKPLLVPPCYWGITLLWDRPHKNTPPDGIVLLKLLSESLVAYLDVVYTVRNIDWIETEMHDLNVAFGVVVWMNEAFYNMKSIGCAFPITQSDMFAPLLSFITSIFAVMKSNLVLAGLKVCERVSMWVCKSHTCSRVWTCAICCASISSLSPMKLRQLIPIGRLSVWIC